MPIMHDMPFNTLYKTQPFEHQLEGLKLARHRPGYAFNCEQGTGKTWMAINEAAQLWGEGKIDAVIVVAPNGVHLNWTRNEIPAHMPDWVQYRSEAWTSNSSKSALARMEKILAPDLAQRPKRELRIYATSWDSIQSSRALEFALRFAHTAPGRLLIVADESHKMKDPTGKRAKAMALLKPYSAFRRTMSGTPILNAPFDAYAQYEFLDSRILKCASFFAFKTEYAVVLGRNDPRVKNIMRKTGSKRMPVIIDENDDGTPKFRNLDRLAELTKKFTFRVLKADALDLPEKIYTRSYFELPPSHKKAYALMRDKARAVFESGIESVESKLTSLMKLQQITSGFMLSPETNAVMPLSDEAPKLELFRERLREIVIEGGKQLIVFARFTEEIKQIAATCEALYISHRLYVGETSDEDRLLAMKDFQAGTVRVFISNQQTGSTGITLTAASHMIYYSNSFSLGDRLQSEDRAHRIGQRSDVLYEDFIAVNTIDEKIVAALRSKKSVADLINGDDATNFLMDPE